MVYLGFVFLSLFMFLLGVVSTYAYVKANMVYLIIPVGLTILGERHPMEDYKGRIDDAVKKWNNTRYYKIIILSAEHKDRIYPPSRYIFNELLAAGIDAHYIQICYDSYELPSYVVNWDSVDELSIISKGINAEEIAMEEIELEPALKSLEG